MNNSYANTVTENETRLIVRVGFTSQISISTLRYMHMAACMKVVPELPEGKRVEPQHSNISLGTYTVVV